MLTGEDAKRVEALEKETDEFYQAGKFTEAQAPASKALEIRRRFQGEQHWQTGDARRLLEVLKQIAALPADARAELARTLVLAREAARVEEQGRYAEGTPLRRQVLEIYRRHLGADHLETATGMEDLAVNLTNSRFYAEAQPLYEKALALRREALGEAHPGTAQSYDELAINLNAQGKYGEAEPSFQKALAISRQVWGEAHTNTALYYNNLATNLSAQGKYAEAEPLFRKALALHRQLVGETHPGTAQCYHNLGANLKAEGKYAEAEPLCRKALALHRQLMGEAHPYTAQCYNTLASNLRAEGKYSEAEPLDQKALAIRRQVLGESHPHTAQSYNNLAFHLHVQGKYSEAEPLFRKALRIRQQTLGEAHPHTAQSYNNLAENLAEQGKYAEAEPSFRRALGIRRQVLGETHPDTAQSYNNLAGSLHAQGQYAEAEAVLQKALAIHRQALGEAHPHTAQSYSNLAFILNAQGKYAEAERLFLKALAIHRQALGEAHGDTARTCHNLAYNLNLQGKSQEAQELWLQGSTILNIARLRSGTSGLERAYFDSGHSTRHLLIHSLVRDGKATDAWHHLENSLARGLLDEVSAGLAQPLPEADRQRVQTLSATLDQVEKQIAALLNIKEQTETSRGRLQGLLQQRREAETELARIAADQAAREVYDLDRIQGQLPAQAALVTWVDASALPGGGDANGVHWACVVRHRGKPTWIKLPGSGPKEAWTKDDDDLMRQLRRTLKTPRDRKQMLKQAVAQRLTPLEACLRGDAENPPVKHLLVTPAWSMAGIPVEVLTDQYTISYVPSGTLFARLRAQRRPSAGQTASAPRLLALGDPNFQRPALPPPAAGPLPENGLLISHVVPQSNAAQSGIRAGDVLLKYAGIQLATLADLKTALGQQPQAKPGDETRVELAIWRDGKTLEVRVRPGPLGINTSPRAAKEEILAQRDGDQALRASRGKGWKELLGTRREVAAIARLFDRPLILFGSEASEQRLDQLAAAGELKRFRYLHFATHGEVNPVIALESALILAQDQLPDPVDQILAGKYPYDGKLTAAEMRRWKLDADLVTLSACETGLGERLGGEGYLGFAQALIPAGARSLVVSLWQVDDEATALLMQRFYQNLLGQRGQPPLPKAEALREAKRWLRDLTDKEVNQLIKDLPKVPRSGKVPLEKEAKSLPERRPYADPHYWSAFILIGDPY
jgi:tetratricopeptide (TPR) repeat protein